MKGSVSVFFPLKRRDCFNRKTLAAHAGELTITSRDDDRVLMASTGDDAVDHDVVHGDDRGGQPSRSRSENIIMWWKRADVIKLSF